MINYYLYLAILKCVLVALALALSFLLVDFALSSSCQMMFIFLWTQDSDLKKTFDLQVNRGRLGLVFIFG